jgi:hypothetical protein
MFFSWLCPAEEVIADEYAVSVRSPEDKQIRSTFVQAGLHVRSGPFNARTYIVSVPKTKLATLFSNPNVAKISGRCLAKLERCETPRSKRVAIEISQLFELSDSVSVREKYELLAREFGVQSPQYGQFSFSGNVPLALIQKMRMDPRIGQIAQDCIRPALPKLHEQCLDERVPDQYVVQLTPGQAETKVKELEAKFKARFVSKAIGSEVAIPWAMFLVTIPHDQLPAFVEDSRVVRVEANCLGSE